MKFLISIFILNLHLFGFENIKISQAQQKDLGVSIQSVSAIEHIEYGPFSGTVILDKKNIIYISSNIESIVDTIHVRELDYVKKGQKLITIKSNALLSVQQEYIQALLEQENANENYKRNVKLLSEGIISSKKLLESKKIKRSNDLKVTLSSSHLLTNGFSSWMLKKIKKDAKPIDKITLYAKRSGIVHNVNINIGEYISAEHKMIEIYADGKRFIELVIPVKNVQNIALGDNVKFSTFDAKITAISNTVNTISQSVFVRGEIQNSQNIMINRVYEAKISKAVSAVYKIKKTALVFYQNKSLIFKKIESGFEVMQVDIIKEGPTCYIVKSELSVSDFVAASSTSALLSAMDSDDE